MRTVNVLNLERISAEDRAKIEALDPAVDLTDAKGWFDGEYRETWPAYSSTRYLAPGATGSGTLEDRDRLLADAEIILGGWPFPLDLRARAPKLKWFHQRPAGASNLLRGDLWGSDVTVTTTRGSGNTLAMAEYAVAGILHFAKGFQRAAIDRDAAALSPRAYRPLLLEGKTACVVGAGGIGLEVGRLCAALGMRVVGTRRSPQPEAPLPPGFTELGGAGDLDRFLPESDIVVICCQWTPETNRLFEKDRFAAMKPGSVFINVARGEIVDEDALADALERDHLRGAALDSMSGNLSTRRRRGSGPIPECLSRRTFRGPAIRTGTALSTCSAAIYAPTSMASRFAM
jgi:phosphoglycerate dehydrogenase-like enzyme